MGEEVIVLTDLTKKYRSGKERFSVCLALMEPESRLRFL